MGAVSATDGSRSRLHGTAPAFAKWWAEGFAMMTHMPLKTDELEALQARLSALERHASVSASGAPKNQYAVRRDFGAKGDGNFDDTKPVPEQQHFAMGLVWVLLLLVALPSETPLIAHDDWDADMTLDAPDVVEVVDVAHDSPASRHAGLVRIHALPFPTLLSPESPNARGSPAVHSSLTFRVRGSGTATRSSRSRASRSSG